MIADYHYTPPYTICTCFLPIACTPISAPCHVASCSHLPCFRSILVVRKPPIDSQGVQVGIRSYHEGHQCLFAFTSSCKSVAGLTDYKFCMLASLFDRYKAHVAEQLKLETINVEEAGMDINAMCFMKGPNHIYTSLRPASLLAVGSSRSRCCASVLFLDKLISELAIACSRSATVFAKPYFFASSSTSLASCCFSVSALAGLCAECL